MRSKILPKNRYRIILNYLKRLKVNNGACLVKRQKILLLINAEDQNPQGDVMLAVTTINEKKEEEKRGKFRVSNEA